MEIKWNCLQGEGGNEWKMVKLTLLTRFCQIYLRENCLKDHCHLLKSQNLRLYALKFAGSYMQVFTVATLWIWEIPNIKVGAAKDHGRNFTEVMPLLVHHVRDCLLKRNSEIADQGWSDLYVVFTMILCGTNFCILVRYEAHTHKLASSSIAEPVYLISNLYDFK